MLCQQKDQPAELVVVLLHDGEVICSFFSPPTGRRNYKYLGLMQPQQRVLSFLPFLLRSYEHRGIASGQGKIINQRVSESQVWNGAQSLQHCFCHVQGYISVPIRNGVTDLCTPLSKKEKSWDVTR